MKFLCWLGTHKLQRTEHFGERKCVRCGGSYWGNVCEDRHTRYLGNWKWYSAKKLKEIERAGETTDLINGVGKYGQGE